MKKRSDIAKNCRDKVIFYLNGERHEVAAEHGRLMLADYLREQLHLTGTKIVCAEGDCGACSVLRYRPNCGQPHYLPINSCISTVAQMDGSSLVTVEALASHSAHRSTSLELHPVQKAMVQCHGSQCGFCTPGFVIALTGLVEKKICEGKINGTCSISAIDAKNATTGNLCRCTGYQPIIDAAKKVDPSQCESIASRYYSKEQEKDLLRATQKPLFLADATTGFELYAPTTIKDATKYLSKNKSAKILSAATDLGVIHNKFKNRLTQVMSLHLINELNAITFTKPKAKSLGRVTVGARVTLTDIRNALKDKAPEFARFLDLFASPQIKNVATLIGNVANASPIADTPPFLLVANASVHIAGPTKRRKVKIEEFFLSYRKTAVKPGEIITAIEFDLPPATDKLQLRKVSERKDLDISTVNTAFRLTYTKSAIASARLAVGGVAATTLRLYKTEKYLEGKTLNTEVIEQAAELLQSEITPLSDVRGSAAYRRVLAENLFRAFAQQQVAK